MNQNPLLLATLFLKYQPAAKTFEEAVAMEVESIEKDKQAVENELTELANKDSALRMRIRELDAYKQELGAPSAPTAKPKAEEKQQVLTLLPKVEPTQNHARRVRDFGTRRSRLRSGTTVQEYIWRDYQYITIARDLGIGTHEAAPMRAVWLVESEVVSVRARINTSGVMRGSTNRAFFGRRDAGKKGWSEGRKYLSAHYVSLAREVGVGEFGPDGSVVFATIDDYRKVRNLALQREQQAAAK